MKTIKITIATLLLLTLANNAKAQATASATASATIVAPITIVNAQDMNFGNVAVSASPGTVVLAASPLVSRTPSGGATLPSTTGVVGAAMFTVGGAPNYTFAITLPSAAHTITHTNNTDVMTVDNFLGSITSGALTGAGSLSFFVGATLNVAGSQLAGVYTSATGFDVTVNYN